MAPPLLALRDIHLTFGSTPLLTGADIAVHERERLCLVGRNGSGKSTLLKIAAGQIEQDGGERFFQPGTTVRYLPQEPDFSDYATVRDYVEDGLVEADDPYRADLCMEALGLTGDEPTANLSGGEARRAALARVLAPEPDILLLDEPTNHLDLPAIAWLEEELSRLRSAIVLISHDRRFLENLSRKTLWVDRGVTRSARQEFCCLRGLARRDAGAGRTRRPQARPQDRARGALGDARRFRPPQAQHEAAGRPRRPAPATCRTVEAAGRRHGVRRGGGNVRQAGVEGRRRFQGLWRPRAGGRFLVPHRAGRPHRHRRAERCGQDDACSTSSPDRPSRTRHGRNWAPISKCWLSTRNAWCWSRTHPSATR